MSNKKKKTVRNKHQQLITRLLYYNLQCSVLTIYKNYKYSTLLEYLLLICNHNIIIIEALQSFARSPACVYYCITLLLYESQYFHKKKNTFVECLCCMSVIIIWMSFQTWKYAAYQHSIWTYKKTVIFLMESLYNLLSC